MLQLQELSNALDEIEVRPRGDLKLWNIRRQLEAGYRKNFLDIVDKDEVDLLKGHFIHIDKMDSEEGFDLSMDDIIFVLDRYIVSSNNEPYSQVVESLKTELRNKTLSQEEFLKFAKKYSAPGQNYPIDVFYKRYFKRSPVPLSLPQLDVEPVEVSSLPQLDTTTNDSEKPTLTDIFGDELDDLSDDDEEDKLQRVRQRIEDKKEEAKTIQVIEPRAEPRRGRIALVRDEEPVPRPRIPEPKPVADRIFFETMTDLTKQDCEFLYKKIPWVKDIVNHIYIHPLEGNFEDVIDYDKFIDHDGLKFYQPKEKYYFIQCHAHKVQEGNALTIVKNGESYKVMVAIDTNTKGIVLQNEDMLKAEIDYVRVWNQNKNENIKELRRNKPNEDMLLLAKFDLASSLQDAIPGNVPIAYRSSSSPFIDTVVQTIFKNSNSGESFVRLLANLIIFLKINISFITSSVFIKRLREQIYLPGTLPFLTDADKLPEIFQVKNVPEDTKNFVLEKLEEERIKFTKNFFENLYIGSSMIRRPTKPTLWRNKPTRQIELPDIKTICKNRDEIENENDEDIVFYTDLNEVYCFNVFKLYDLFQKEETPINPYTRRPFTDKFIQIFLTRYASKPLVKKIEHVKHQDLTSRLEQMIERELSMLENNLIETENPAFIERFKNSISPPIVENKNNLKDKIEDKTNKCMECKKELGTDQIGSVFRNKEVAFCGYDCLEKNKAFK